MRKLGFGVFWTGIAALAPLGACHSDAAGSPDLSQVNSFIQAQAQAACDWEFKCCKDAEIKANDQNKYTTKAECLAYEQLAQEDSLYLARLAVSEGRMRVDSTHAAACIHQRAAAQQHGDSEQMEGLDDRKQKARVTDRNGDPQTIAPAEKGQQHYRRSLKLVSHGASRRDNPDPEGQ